MIRKVWLLRILRIAFASLLILASVAFALIWNGVILLNNPSYEKYPVRGVDVSSYQGNIAWNVLSKAPSAFSSRITASASFYSGETKKFSPKFSFSLWATN